MLRALTFAAVLSGAAVVHADPFFVYDSRGNTTFGTTYPGGGFATDNYGRVTSWTIAPQPLFVPNYGYGYGAYPAYNYYRPVYAQPIVRSNRWGWGW